mmetsp:Transcript_128947/g.412947  ORF Transcript_128947/g.412947 Transcript_128947/m.412947 type:complete len:329 (-) Transcript_128947:32-1018(-)
MLAADADDADVRLRLESRCPRGRREEGAGRLEPNGAAEQDLGAGGRIAGDTAADVCGARHRHGGPLPQLRNGHLGVPGAALRGPRWAHLGGWAAPSCLRAVAGPPGQTRDLCSTGCPAKHHEAGLAVCRAADLREEGRGRGGRPRGGRASKRVACMCSNRSRAAPAGARLSFGVHARGPCPAAAMGTCGAGTSPSAATTDGTGAALWLGAVCRCGRKAVLRLPALQHPGALGASSNLRPRRPRRPLALALVIASNRRRCPLLCRSCGYSYRHDVLRPPGLAALPIPPPFRGRRLRAAPRLAGQLGPVEDAPLLLESPSRCSHEVGFPI